MLGPVLANVPKKFSRSLILKYQSTYNSNRNQGIFTSNRCNKIKKYNHSVSFFNNRYFSTKNNQSMEIAEAELGEDDIIFDSKEEMKYWRIGGVLSVFQFYSSAAMSAYLLYTSDPVNMLERLGMSGLAVGMTGIVLFGVHMVTRSIVVEIRQDKKINKVEFTTLGLLGYDIKEYNIHEMIDPFQKNKSFSTIPGFLYMKHSSGSLFALQLQHADKDHLKDLYELSCL
jgi:hypothetical protein